MKRIPIDRVKFPSFPPSSLFSPFILGLSLVSAFLLVLSTSCLCFFLCLSVVFTLVGLFFTAAEQQLSLLPSLPLHLSDSQAVNSHDMLLTQGCSYGEGASIAATPGGTSSDSYNQFGSHLLKC